MDKFSGVHNLLWRMTNISCMPETWWKIIFLKEKHTERVVRQHSEETGNMRCLYMEACPRTA